MKHPRMNVARHPQVCALYMAVFLYVNIWDRWESRFDHMCVFINRWRICSPLSYITLMRDALHCQNRPWSDSFLAGKHENGRRASMYKGDPCPFTGALCTQQEYAEVFGPSAQSCCWHKHPC